jgi:hypothetical protein
MNFRRKTTTTSETCFGRRGGYRNFRALVTIRRVLELWYDFEAKATKRAVREWCEFNGIEVID